MKMIRVKDTILDMEQVLYIEKLGFGIGDHCRISITFKNMKDICIKFENQKERDECFNDIIKSIDFNNKQYITFYKNYLQAFK